MVRVPSEQVGAAGGIDQHGGPAAIAIYRWGGAFGWASIARRESWLAKVQRIRADAIYSQSSRTAGFAGCACTAARPAIPQRGWITGNAARRGVQAPAAAAIRCVTVYLTGGSSVASTRWFTEYSLQATSGSRNHCFQTRAEPLRQLGETGSPLLCQQDQQAQ